MLVYSTNNYNDTYIVRYEFVQFSYISYISTFDSKKKNVSKNLKTLSLKIVIEDNLHIIPTDILL